MKVKVSLLIIIIAIISSNCNPKKERSNNKNIVLDTFYYSNGKIEQIIQKIENKLNGDSKTYFENGRLKIRKFFLNGTAFGPFYEYYENGQLKKMAFMFNDSCSRYIAEYNEKGRLLNELGNPLVKYTARQSENKDTLFLEMLFFIHDYFKFRVELCSDGIHYKEAPIKDYNLEYTKKINLWKIVKTLNISSFYFKIICTDTNNNLKEYRDTLSFNIIK